MLNLLTDQFQMQISAKRWPCVRVHAITRRANESKHGDCVQRKLNSNIVVRRLSIILQCVSAAAFFQFLVYVVKKCATTVQLNQTLQGLYLPIVRFLAGSERFALIVVGRCYKYG